MTREAFTEIIQNPSALKESAVALKNFIDQHPYCQPAWIALLKMLGQEEKEFRLALSQAAPRFTSALSVYEYLKETEVEANEKSELSEPLRQKIEIIDSFIQNQPRIIPKEADFEEAEKLAQKSNEDQLNFVSETLAEIYLSQGNKTKAKKIYEELALKYPEKSTYFAGLIEKLKNNH